MESGFRLPVGVSNRADGEHRPRELGSDGQDGQASTRLVAQAVRRAQAGDREALGFQCTGVYMICSVTWRSP